MSVPARHYMEPVTQHSPKKIKLAFLVRSLDYGGAQRQLITLAKALDKSIFEVTVLSFYDGQPLERGLDGSGVQTIFLGKSGRWDLFSFLRRLLKEVKLLHPDILHGYLDIPNLLALFLKPFVRARVIWGVRAAELKLERHAWLQKMAAGVERLLARFPDLILVNSVAAREYHLARGFPAARLVMIPNGIDTEYFKPDPPARAELRREWNVTENTCLVGILGRIDPVKDLPLFLEAAAIVLRQLTDVRFICVGSGPAAYSERLRTLAREIGLSDQITWAPARPDVVAAYNALDLLVSSSRSESFPNTVAEAMSCGVPCVVTDVGDSALLVGECGIVVPPQDAESLAAAIVQSLKMSGTGPDKNSRARIVAEFSVQQLAKRTAEVLLTKTMSPLP